MINKESYQKLIDEDVEWLDSLPTHGNGLCQSHIRLIVKDSVNQYYPGKEDLETENKRLKEGIEQAMKIKDLWLGQQRHCIIGLSEDVRALRSMEKTFKDLLTTTEKTIQHR